MSTSEFFFHWGNSWAIFYFAVISKITLEQVKKHYKKEWRLQAYSTYKNCLWVYSMCSWKQSKNQKNLQPEKPDWHSPGPSAGCGPDNNIKLCILKEKLFHPKTERKAVHYAHEAK